MNKVVHPLAPKEHSPFPWKNLLRKKSRGSLAQCPPSSEEPVPSLPRPSLSSLRSFGSYRLSSSTPEPPVSASTLPARMPLGDTGNIPDSLGRRRGAHASTHGLARDIDFPQSAPPDVSVFAKFFPLPDALDAVVARGSLDRPHPPGSAPPAVTTFAKRNAPVRSVSDTVVTLGSLDRHNSPRRAPPAVAALPERDAPVRSVTTRKSMGALREAPKSAPPVVMWFDKEKGQPCARRETLTHGDIPHSAPASVGSFPDLPTARRRSNSLAARVPAASPLQAKLRKRDSLLAKSRMSVTSENRARSTKRAAKEDLPPVPPVPPVPQLPEFPVTESVANMFAYYPSLLGGSASHVNVAASAPLVSLGSRASRQSVAGPRCEVFVPEVNAADYAHCIDGAWMDPFAIASDSQDTVRAANSSPGMQGLPSWDSLDLHSIIASKPPAPVTEKPADDVLDLSALLEAYESDPSMYSHESSIRSDVPSIRVTEYHDSFAEEKSVHFADEDDIEDDNDEEDDEIDWLELHILLSLFPRPPPLLSGGFSPDPDEPDDIWAAFFADSSIESQSTPPLIAELWSNDLEDEVARFTGEQARRKKRHGIMFA